MNTYCAPRSMTGIPAPLDGLAGEFSAQAGGVAKASPATFSNPQLLAALRRQRRPPAFINSGVFDHGSSMKRRCPKIGTAPKLLNFQRFLVDQSPPRVRRPRDSTT